MNMAMSINGSSAEGAGNTRQSKSIAPTSGVVAGAELPMVFAILRNTRSTASESMSHRRTKRLDKALRSDLSQRAASIRSSTTSSDSDSERSSHSPS